MITKKQLQLTNEQLMRDIQVLSHVDDIQRKTIKELRTIIGQLVIGIGYSEDQKLDRLVSSLIQEYGPGFLGLGE